MTCPLPRAAPLKTELDTLRESLSGVDSDSTTCQSCGIDSEYMALDIGTDSNAVRARGVAQNRDSIVASTNMTKAALYARVSSDIQQKEGTIEGQVAALRRQIHSAGHELVKNTSTTDTPARCSHVP